MRGSIISRRIRSGSSSATAARALSPSLAVMTRIFSRCRVNCTILRTVGLSSTTSTTGSFINSTSFGPAPGPFVDQNPCDAYVNWLCVNWRDHYHRGVQSAQSAAPRRAPVQTPPPPQPEEYALVLQFLVRRLPTAPGSGAQNENWQLPLLTLWRKPRASANGGLSSHPNKSAEVVRP